MFSFPYRKYRNRLNYFYIVLYGPCPKIFVCLRWWFWDLALFLMIFYERYFKVLLFRVKCSNSALLFIHVCNEWCLRACTRPLRGQVRCDATSRMPFLLGCTCGSWHNVYLLTFLKSSKIYEAIKEIIEHIFFVIKHIYIQYNFILVWTQLTTISSGTTFLRK